MKINYSISQVDVAGHPTYISTIRGFGIKRPSDVINQYLTEGRREINTGIAIFSNRKDSEAAPRIELGSHYLYLISAAENIEQTTGGKLAPVNEVLSTDEKVRLFGESLENAEITNLIYAKKLLVLSTTANPEILERAIADSIIRDGLNRMLDELFKEHARFLPNYTGAITAAIIKGIKIRLVGDAYICLSKGRRPVVSKDRINHLLQQHGISPNDDFGKLYDGDDLLTTAKRLIEKANNILGPIDPHTELNSADIKNAIDLAKQNDHGVNGTTAAELFYSRLPITPMILQPLGQSIIVSSFTTTSPTKPVEPQKLIPNKALVNVTEQTELTDYEKHNTNTPFPITKLTRNDVSRIFAREKSDKKDLFLRYWQLLNNGRTPHSETSPRKSRLFFHSSERRAFDGVNRILESKSITPMFLFNAENQTLRQLYSAYKEINKQSNPGNIVLEENYSPKQLENICLYLDKNNAPQNRDEDFCKLAQIDPDFAICVLSSEFIDKLLDIATKPKTKEQAPILESPVDEPTEQVPEAHSNEGATESEPQYPIPRRVIKGESIEFTNTPMITGIEIPLLDLLGFNNYLETGKLPGGEELVVTYKGKKHILGTHSKTHDEVHHYHKGKHTVRVIVSYSDGSKKEIKPYITNVKHTLKELKESGQSTYVLKDHHES